MGLASTAVLVSVVLVSASFTSGTFTSVKEFYSPFDLAREHVFIFSLENETTFVDNVRVKFVQ